MRLVAWVTGLVAAVACSAAEPALAAQPEVWMMPPCLDGRSFRELFANPDQWGETRKLVHVLACTDLQTKKLFTDDELKAWFARMNAWGLKFGMEVGAIKPWGLTGEKTFAVEQPK